MYFILRLYAFLLKIVNFLVRVVCNFIIRLKIKCYIIIGFFIFQYIICNSS